MNRTARTIVALVLVCLTLTFAGCGPGRDELIRRGDACMHLDRPAEAVTHYGKALEKDPHLTADDVFMTKLRRAKAHSAYRKGTDHAAGRDWRAAIASFQRSVENDPTFRKAADALRNARRQGAKAHHRRALDYADQGDLNRAIGELKRALELDGDNLDAKDALQSVRQRKVGQTGRAGTLYNSAVAMQQEKRWLKSAGALNEAIALNPNHLPARADLHRSLSVLVRARSQYRSGANLLADKRLDEAIRTLGGALEAWPFFAEATEALAQAKASRRQVEDLYTKATALAKQDRWDDVVEATVAALRIYPYHQHARVLLPQARQSAAAAHCDRGDRLLAAGDFDEADEAFQRAAFHVPESSLARKGQAKADYMRGLAAEKKQLWGNALLSYIKAADHAAGGDYTGKLRAMRLKVLDRISFTVGVKAVVSDRGSIVDPASARSCALQCLGGERPRFVAIAPDKAWAQATYSATLRLDEPELETRRTGRYDKTHQYTIHRKVPNPEIPRLRGLIRSGRSGLDRLTREYNRLCATCSGKGNVTCSTCRGTTRYRCVHCGGGGRTRCGHCGGAGRAAHHLNCTHCGASGRLKCATCQGGGKTRCGRCRGSGKTRCGRCKERTRAHVKKKCTHCGASGTVICSTCSGHGHARCGHCTGTGAGACPHCKGAGRSRAYRNCTHCGASGRSACPACRGLGHGRCGTCANSARTPGRVTCPHCRGRGRATTITQRDLDRRRDCITDLEWKLRRAPDRVTRGFAAEWRYVLCTHTKSGSMDASVSIATGLPGRTGWSFTVRDTVSSDDTTIENANPDIGLYADSLDLPSDRTVCGRLVSSVSHQAARRVLAGAVGAEISHARERVRKAAAGNDRLAVVEASVDLAHLTEWSSSREALQILNALHAEHKEQAAVKKSRLGTTVTKLSK